MRQLLDKFEYNKLKEIVINSLEGLLGHYKPNDYRKLYTLDIFMEEFEKDFGKNTKIKDYFFIDDTGDRTIKIRVESCKLEEEIKRLSSVFDERFENIVDQIRGRNLCVHFIDPNKGKVVFRKNIALLNCVQSITCTLYKDMIFERYHDIKEIKLVKPKYKCFDYNLLVIAK